MYDITLQVCLIGRFFEIWNIYELSDNIEIVHETTLINKKKIVKSN